MSSCECEISISTAMDFLNSFQDGEDASASSEIRPLVENDTSVE